jgi:hypothetical protein
MSNIDHLFSKRIKRKVEVFFKILILIIIFFGIYNIWGMHNISKYKKYTIATTIKAFYNAAPAKVILYKFSVENIKYSATIGFHKSINVPNGRYIVAYNSRDPDHSKLLINYIIPDTLKYIPTNGWDSIPYYIIDSSKKP